MLRLSDVSVDVQASSKVPVTKGGGTAELFTELEKYKGCIAEIKSAKTITVYGHEEIMGKIGQRRAEEAVVWKETSRKNANSLISNVNVAKVGMIRISVVRNLILARFEEHVQALQTLINTHVERKVSLIDAMVRIRELFESVHSTDRSDHYVMILISARMIRQLSGLVESNGLESQTMLWPDDEASRLCEKIPKRKGKKIA